MKNKTINEVPIEASPTKFEVINKHGEVTNIYSIENNGVDAESCANNYAQKIGGTVVKYA